MDVTYGLTIFGTQDVGRPTASLWAGVPTWSSYGHCIIYREQRVETLINHPDNHSNWKKYVSIETYETYILSTSNHQLLCQGYIRCCSGYVYSKTFAVGKFYLSLLGIPLSIQNHSMLPSSTFVQALGGICVWVVAFWMILEPQYIQPLYLSLFIFIIPVPIFCEGLWHAHGTSSYVGLGGYWPLWTRTGEVGRRAGVGFTSSWEWQKISTH